MRYRALGSTNSGRYATVFAHPSGKFTYAIDGGVTGPMSPESAWLKIDEEPVMLFHAKDGVER